MKQDPGIKMNLTQLSSKDDRSLNISLFLGRDYCLCIERKEIRGSERLNDLHKITMAN